MNRSYLTVDDWDYLIQDIIDTHPGLKFLREAREFHSRYIKTVVARIYYNCNRSWSGKLTVQELRRANFLPVINRFMINFSEYKDVGLKGSCSKNKFHEKMMGVDKVVPQRCRFFVLNSSQW